MYVLGIVATIIGIAGGLPYIYDTYRRKTKPHRVAWLIFLILSLILFSSQLALGARASLIFYGWFVLNNLILFSLSMRKGGGYGDVNTLNVISFVLAMAAIVLWKVTDSPLVALLCTLLADGVGVVLILFKSYRHPHTETLIMWQAGAVATFLNVFAVGTLKFELLVAPVMVFLANLGIVAAIILGRRQVDRRGR